MRYYFLIHLRFLSITPSDSWSTGSKDKYIPTSVWRIDKCWTPTRFLYHKVVKWSFVLFQNNIFWICLPWHSVYKNRRKDYSKTVLLILLLLWLNYLVLCALFRRGFIAWPHVQPLNDFPVHFRGASSPLPKNSSPIIDIMSYLYAFFLEHMFSKNRWFKIRMRAQYGSVVLDSSKYEFKINDFQYT